MTIQRADVVTLRDDVAGHMSTVQGICPQPRGLWTYAQIRTLTTLSDDVVGHMSTVQGICPQPPDNTPPYGS